MSRRLTGAHQAAGSRHSTKDPDTGGFYLFSPSSSYPQPFACLINRQGDLIHVWSNARDQPEPSSNPPTYLRGWNHVELDIAGNLYVTVPLHSLLKLAPDSQVLWRAEVSAHHDLDIARDGTVYVLTEEPRRVRWRGATHLILDADVTVLDNDGRTVDTHSIYEILCTQPLLRALINEEIRRRRAEAGEHPAAARISPAGSAEPVAPALDHTYGNGATRDTLSRLREQPGSPSDVLHANTLEVLQDHPDGVWQHGHVLVSLRNLDLIAVLDLQAASVVWWWGPGELSGQHQPSALPNGNVLVFDNGQTRGRSRVVEIDPATRSIQWQYVADPPTSLFSPVAGGCEMLDNGEILITDSQAGRAIEVTRHGETVWGVNVEKLDTGPVSSRAAIYRMSSVPAAAVAAAGLGGGPAARHLVDEGRFTCTLDGAGGLGPRTTRDNP